MKNEPHSRITRSQLVLNLLEHRREDFSQFKADTLGRIKGIADSIERTEAWFNDLDEAIKDVMLAKTEFDAVQVVADFCLDCVHD